MGHLWRILSFALIMILATTGTVLLTEQAHAGTPVTGDIVVDTVWSPAGSPYWIETDVTVLAGIELVVLAGAEVRFNGSYRLYVGGRILVQGTAMDPVLFTSNSSTPSPSDWGGLSIFGECHVNHANISYAVRGIYTTSSYNTINESSFYRNEDALFISTGFQNLVRNNTLYFNTARGIVIWQSNSNNITGNNASMNVDTGLWLYESANNTVSRNEFYGNNQNGIRISSLSTSNRIVKNTIMDSQLYQGIGVWDSHDNRILGNTIRRNNNNGIYLEASTGNNVSRNNISDSVDYHGISLWYADGNTILNNTIRKSSGNGIYLGYSNSNEVRGNDISDNVNFHGVSMYSASSNDISWNRIGSLWSDGVYMEDSWSNTISNNTINDTNNGISMYDSWTIGVFDNKVTVADDGIRSRGSWDVEIIRNSLSGNYAGIGIGDYSSNVSVIGNTVQSNTAIGIEVWLSDWITLVGNEIVQNAALGLAISESPNSTIRENNITSNGLYGIYADLWSDTHVYHNNFVDNPIQAFDLGASENSWDNGYPSGGNYWSDYTGIDAYSGPNQDQPGSDSIGDTPYVIDSDSQDDYPLVHPFGTDYSLPPTNLDARLSGNGLENVTLTWNLSADDGGGKDDVIRYDIHRGTTYDRRGNGYVLLDQLSNGTSTYVDLSVGEGDPDNYFYRLCAVNSKDVSSCAPYQGAKFTRQLAPGPNLVSVPLKTFDGLIDIVLQTVRYDNVWSYDSSSREWKSSMKHKTYSGGLSRLNHTMGMWVNVTKTSNLTVAGIVPAQTTIHLHEGWNLASFPSINASYTVADLKAETGATRVEGYDPDPPYFLRVLGDPEVHQAGYGYWVRVEADTIWTVSFA
ncbi:MAG: right-handed parallel beta-helix repeat-containing protein [Candidatus Thermoplasmatota archaeon]|nr:right-handed parallel beta-helix repeat-containing protein [Candidatus Thermoplasmatota archaeon]